MEKRNIESTFVETSDQAGADMTAKLLKIPEASARLDMKGDETSMAKRLKRDESEKIGQGTTTQIEGDVNINTSSRACLTLNSDGGLYSFGDILLYVTKGAVQKDTPITISRCKGPMDSFGLPKHAWGVSDQIVLTPHDLRYDQPIYLVFPHQLPKEKLLTKKHMSVLMLNKDTPTSPWQTTGSCQGQDVDFGLDLCKSKMAFFSEKYCVVEMNRNCVNCAVTIGLDDARRMYGLMYLDHQQSNTGSSLGLRLYTIHEDKERFKSLERHEREKGELLRHSKMQVATDTRKILTVELQLPMDSQWSPLNTSMMVSPSILRPEWEQTADSFSPMASLELRAPAGVTPTSIRGILSVTQMGVPAGAKTMEEMDFAFDMPMDSGRHFQAIDEEGTAIAPDNMDVEAVVEDRTRSDLLRLHLTAGQATSIAQHIFHGFDAAALPNPGALINVVIAECSHWINDRNATRPADIIDFLHRCNVHNAQLENAL